MTQLSVGRRGTVTVTDVVVTDVEPAWPHRPLVAHFDIGDTGDELHLDMGTGHVHFVADRPQLPSGPTVLILTVGAPGCGKTTWLESVLPKEAILRLDDYRVVMTGDESDQSVNPTAVTVRNLLLWERMRHRLTTAVDATNAKALYRHDLMLTAQQLGAPVIVVWWRVGLDECLRRQENRPRQVDPPVVARILDEIEQDANDLRVTAHVIVEIDAADRATVHVGSSGLELGSQLPAVVAYARDLAETFGAEGRCPTLSAPTPAGPTDPGIDIPDMEDRL